LVSEEDVALDASVATADEVLHVFRGQDRERILDQLNGRTSAAAAAIGGRVRTGVQ
jgi:hypothetical protein